MKEKILVSACLMGQRVRYDGAVVPVHERLVQWKARNLIIPFCPEVEGGLTIPRPPAEIWGGDGALVMLNKARVKCQDGHDVTDSFVRGAFKALEIARANAIRFAVLKDGSPSCGSTRIYDGTFSKKSIGGKGVAAALLEQEGLVVFTENDIDSLVDHMDSIKGS